MHIPANNNLHVIDIYSWKKNNFYNLPLKTPKTNTTNVTFQFPLKRLNPRLKDHNRKRMLKLGITLLLYLHRGQILLWVGSTHHAAGDVALVSQEGAGVAASGGGKRTLEDSLRRLASAVTLAVATAGSYPPGPPASSTQPRGCQRR